MRAVHSLVLAASILCAVMLAIRLTPIGTAHAAANDASAPKFAVCAVPMLVNELMQSDRFKPDRDKMEADFRAELDDMAAKLRELGAELQKASQDDPSAHVKAEEFGRLRNEFFEKQRQVAEALEKKSAEQLLACYELARSSTTAVAENLGYDYVFASVGPDEKLSGDSVEIALRQMMSRPVVVAPKQVDITEDVRADLKL